MSNKYGAKGFWYHTITKEKFEPNQGPRKAARENYLFFHSQLEWDVYELLLNYFPSRKIYKEWPLMLANGEVRDHNVSISYKIDFLVERPPGEPDLYVEAKGVLTEASRIKLQLLGINLPGIAENTHLIFRDAVKVIASCPVNYHSFKGFKEWLNENF